MAKTIANDEKNQKKRSRSGESVPRVIGLVRKEKMISPLKIIISTKKSLSLIMKSCYFIIEACLNFQHKEIFILGSLNVREMGKSDVGAHFLNHNF